MHCRARSLFIAVVVALGILGMLGACGQKGPLYLPEKMPATVPGADVPVTPALAPSAVDGATATSTTRSNPH
jgi:predicted small lipoprotein YifL